MRCDPDISMMTVPQMFSGLIASSLARYRAYGQRDKRRFLGGRHLTELNHMQRVGKEQPTQKMPLTSLRQNMRGLMIDPFARKPEPFGERIILDRVGRVKRLRQDRAFRNTA